MEHKTDGRKPAPMVLRMVGLALLNGTMSVSKAAKTFSISRPTVYLIKSRLGNLSVDQFNTLTDEELMQKIYLPRDLSIKHEKNNLFVPDFNEYARQVVEHDASRVDIYRKYVREAQSRNQNYFGMSYFYEMLKGPVDSMIEHQPDYYIPQTYVWGREMQADYSGMKVPLLTYDGVVKCCMLVTVWPKSGKIDASFVRQQSTAEACSVFREIFVRTGACPHILKVDNAKCFVIRHNHSDAEINREFDDFMRRFGVYVDPTPYRAPQSKAAAEFSVCLTQRLVTDFISDFSTEKRTIAQHSRHLQHLIDTHINDGPFRGSHSSTRSFLFNTEEIKCAQKLPENIPEYREMLFGVRVSRAGLITVCKHEYSVPVIYVNQYLDVRLSPDSIEVLSEGEVVASHIRNDGTGRTILEEHKSDMQKSIEAHKRKYATPDDILREARLLHPYVEDFCRAKLNLGNGPNDMRCCIAVINYFKRAGGTRILFAQACKEILNYSPSHWNSYQIKDIYNDLVRQQRMLLEKAENSTVVTSSTNAFLQKRLPSEQFQPGSDSKDFLSHAKEDRR